MLHAVQVGHENKQRLDTANWHQPLCSVVITHRNYSRHINDALLSLLDQTYQNWECAVVDDASDVEEVNAVESIIHRLNDKRIRFLTNESNLGQIPSFYLGLDNTSGEFITLLDPDDRMAPGFIEEMVAAHLNETAYGPVVACDQKMVRLDGGLITGTYRSHDFTLSPAGEPRQVRLHKQPDAPLLYFPAKHYGWVITSTSALMFRRAALNLMRPRRALDYTKAVDAYLWQGAHMLGGTLFLRKSLVYRGVHPDNAWLSDAVYAMSHSLKKSGAEQHAPRCKRDVVEAMIGNGVEQSFPKKQLKEVLSAQFKDEQMDLLRQQCPRVGELLPPKKKESPLKRLRRGVRGVLFGKRSR